MRPSRVTLEQAQELFKTRMPVRKKEEKQSADCLGQILAKPVYAAVTQPPFPRSAMDGFALRSRDICRADMQHPGYIRSYRVVCAGQKTELVSKPYQAVQDHDRFDDTGSADCVVKQEDAEWDERAVRIYHNAKPGENYCPAGEDFSAGDLLQKRNPGRFLSAGSCHSSRSKKPYGVQKTEGGGDHNG